MGHPSPATMHVATATLVEQSMRNLCLYTGAALTSEFDLVVLNDVLNGVSLWHAGLVGGKSGDEQQQSLQDRPVDGTGWCAALCGSIDCSLFSKQWAAAWNGGHLICSKSC